tara:strand:+ start:82275 stop:82889 length:615 start_codon:yes stop_codon:yes gene_type:complete
MKSKHPEIAQRYMLLFKIDAKNLFYRIKERQKEYINIFSLKRSRSIFKDIFSSRYERSTHFDLAHCSQDVIVAMDQFYLAVDDLYWYLKYTQDMPKMIEDEVYRRVNRLERLYETLELYVNAELSGETNEQVEQEDNTPLEDIDDFSEIPPETSHDDQFMLEGEHLDEEAKNDYIQPEHFPDPDELADFEVEENTFEFDDDKSR